MAVADALRALALRPKAELHLHLEGAVRPATLVGLARRAGSPLFHDLAAVRARSRPGSLAGFLTLYRDVCRLLRGPDDFALLARDLTARLRRGRIVYAEVYVSPAVVERVGLPWPPVRAAAAPHRRAVRVSACCLTSPSDRSASATSAALSGSGQTFRPSMM